MNKIYATNQQGTFVTLIMTNPSFLTRAKIDIENVKIVHEIPSDYKDGLSARTEFDFKNPLKAVDIDFDENGVYILVNFPIQEYKEVRLHSNVMHPNKNVVMSPQEIIDGGYLDEVRLKFVYLGV